MLEMLKFSSNCKRKMMKSKDCREYWERYGGERYIFLAHALGSRMRVHKSTAEVRLQISLPLI